MKIRPRGDWRIGAFNVSWEPRWVWVGLAWRHTIDLGRRDTPEKVSLFLCLLPCLPIVLVIERARR